nr:hypothetical protein [uncultured Gellertiella sp.]
MALGSRIVVHFPGFEPLGAEDHRKRYARSALQSAAVWNAKFVTGPLAGDRFCVAASGPDWTMRSTIHVRDHDGLISRLRSVGLIRQILLGFAAAFRVMMEGGMTGYFRHAWRFGLFFVFPFQFVLSALAVSLSIMLLPLALDLPHWHLLWSLLAGPLFFVKVFLPFSERLHTLHLLADWRLAVHVARLDDGEVNRWLGDSITMLEEALKGEADDYLVTAHSMGASLALHALGGLLERNPDAFRGKRLTFATLGGAALQCALLKSAVVLRRRIRLVAECPGITWFEVQSLTDPVHLYKARTVSASGFADAPQPPIVPFRFRTVLSEERYRRIKSDILRMHRQYVLGPDRRGSFDFTLLTAGPLPSAQFAAFTSGNLPPIGEDGCVTP